MKKKRDGFGEEFTATVLEYATYLSDNAHSQPKVNGEYRELIIKRFPYVIVYRIVKEDQVMILGVIHVKKHPSVRRKRK